MSLTRDFKETILARVERDPGFRQALLEEAVEHLLSGDVETGKLLLRDYINATIGFQELGGLTEKSPKSLMRMFSPAGNPNASNLFEVIDCLQKREGCHLTVQGVREPGSTMNLECATRNEMANGPRIEKSAGLTDTERLLSGFCERTFLGLWSYPNPFKDDGKELCDLIVVFEDHVILFFDRESRKFDNQTKDLEVTWNRWKKEAIDKQVRTAKGAKRYIEKGGSVYLDSKKRNPFPLDIRRDSKISKFVIAHGAEEACKTFSSKNIYGSLAICYGEYLKDMSSPFLIGLDCSEIVHVLDSKNLPILFETLDTIHDFSAYITEKEKRIGELNAFCYSGEEDLIAHYLKNFNEEKNRFQIGPHDEQHNSLFIAEGCWQTFSRSNQYTRWKEANEPSYFWDKLIQKTCRYALDGTIAGTANLFRGKSAIHEMAKEPRLFRRTISKLILQAIENFPENRLDQMRHVVFVPSHFENVGYVFLQLHSPDMGDYEQEYRPIRRAMLEAACGAAKNKFPQLVKVIGIAMEAPKHSKITSEDFALFECHDWPDDEAERYRQANKLVNFFQTKSFRQHEIHEKEFPN